MLLLTQINNNDVCLRVWWTTTTTTIGSCWCPFQMTLKHWKRTCQKLNSISTLLMYCIVSCCWCFSLSRLRCLLSFSFPLYLCFMRLFYFGLCVVFVIVTYRSTDNYAVIEGITSIPVNSCAIRTPTMNKNTCKFQSSRFCLPSLYVNQFGIWHMNHT